MTNTKYPTREQWLQAAVADLRVLLDAQGHTVPRVYVSVGFPGGGSRRTRIGECWRPEASSDGVGHVFISPILIGDVLVLGTLAHELVHAVNHSQGESGHGKCFADIAKPLGLTGKMTATGVGVELASKLEAIGAALGEYPHALLKPGGSPVKKQTTRMRKIECPCCGYTVRTTQKWIDAGLPSCPLGTPMVSSES
jgi:hypothetical protein